MSETLKDKDNSVEKTAQNTDQNEKVDANDNDIEKCNVKSFQWFYERNFDKFFQFVRNKSEKSVQVRCLQCPPSKLLTVTANSAFNLNTHFKSTHKEMNQQFLERTKKRKLDDEISNDSEPKQKQMKLTSDAFVGQKQLDKLVLDYVVEKVLPFSTVECKSFEKLVLSGKSTRLQVMTRKKLVETLIREFNILKNGQINEYSAIQYFCLTADLWSSRRRAFLGVTIHWICPKTFARKMNALACRRIKGKHTGDVLAAHIDEIIKSYEIPIRKILKIITDGGSNFKRAFKDHQLEEDITEDEEDIEDLTDLLGESNNEQIFLPPHGRCGCHSICLILTSDIKIKKQKATKKKKEMTPFEIEYKTFRERILDPVLAKCQDLFNKQQNSAKAADLVHSYLNRYLITPSPTRWNSLFDSIVLLSELLEKMPDKILNVTNGLGLEKITPRDHAILKEYIKLTENLANALDILQGEKYMYQGVYSPTIHKMKQKIDDIQELAYCLPLKKLILKSIEKRFPDVMKDDYLKASLLHPLFKSYPMYTPTVKRRLVSELAVELQEILDKNNSAEKENIGTSVNNRGDIENLSTFKKLFDYDIDSGFSGAQCSSTVNAEIILHNYLSSADTSMESLINYPEIGKLFIRYNTVLCSSAACERLFSLAKHVLRADRCQLKDENFEAQLILKANLFPSKNSSNRSDSVEI